MPNALERQQDVFPDPIGPPPDRIAIWPIEDGTFGIDATFQGPFGHRHARFHEAILRVHEIRCSVREEPDEGGWTLRLGPLPRPIVEQAVALFIAER
jgi:hypothetical protein